MNERINLLHFESHTLFSQDMRNFLKFKTTKLKFKVDE